MHAPKTRTVVALVAVALAPAALAAQQPTPAQPTPAPPPAEQPQLPAEVQGWITEIQQLEARLGPLQAQAMEDPGVQQAQTELQAAMQSALEQTEPAVQADLRRAETLQADLAAAQEAGDQAQLQRLIAEANELQQRFAEIQRELMQRPEVASSAEAFQTRLQARMIAIDPEARTMIERHGQLQTRIMQAMQGMQGTAPPGS